MQQSVDEPKELRYTLLFGVIVPLALKEALSAGSIIAAANLY